MLICQHVPSGFHRRRRPRAARLRKSAPQHLSCLLGAFKFGDTEVARTLFELGTPLEFADGNGITMLGRAALNNEVGMAKTLLDRGANVNVVDKLGMTPLLWAASMDFGDPAMIELLLKSGAKADARTKDGLTALELARKYGHTELFPALTRPAPAK